MADKIRKSVDDVRQAVVDMARSAPLVKVGETLGKAGGAMQRGYDKAERYVRKTVSKSKPVRRDINLPRERRR